MKEKFFFANILKLVKAFLIALKYLVILALTLVILLIIILAPAFKELTSVATNSLAAKNNLEQSVERLRALDLEVAAVYASNAKSGFHEALVDLEMVVNKPIINKVSILRNQFVDLSYLLKTGEALASALNDSLPLANNFSSLFFKDNAFSPLNEEKKAEFVKLLYNSTPDLISLKAYLELALLDLNKIKKFGILYPVYQDLVLAKNEFQSALKLLEQVIDLSKVVPALAGYPEEGNFLFIMHNNDELRPSGGFIGVFGLMKTKNARVESLNTYDSYHLDMPAMLSGKWKMEPPAAISKYLKVDNWYLRDANWSPDWPTSAKKIQEIYQGEKLAIAEDPGSFTGIIGLSPDFIAELIDLVGPITARGDVYYKENFQELLQYSVEMSYEEQGVSSWDRKDVINEIVYELKERLFNLGADKFYTLLNIVSDNVNKKNIQLYFNDSYLQSLAQQLNVSAEIKQSVSDYLLVVDANLAAFKSDAVVKKSIDYEVDLGTKLAKVDLRLAYRHEGGFDWRTTRYRSYTRVYVPLGSKLNSVEAFGLAKLETSSVISYNDLALKKTVFAFFFSLEPGLAGGIDLQYDLPLDLNTNLNLNNYSLLLQKQSGRRTESFNFRLKSEGKLKKEASYPLNTDSLISY